MEIVEKKLAVGRKHPGGFILSTACSIAPDVPPENIALLQKIVYSNEILVSEQKQMRICRKGLM